MKKCKKCGKEINDLTEVCLYCGTNQSDFTEDANNDNSEDHQGTNSFQGASSTDNSSDAADDTINLKGTKWSNNGGEAGYENRGTDNKGTPGFESQHQQNGDQGQGQNQGFYNQGQGQNQGFYNQGQGQNQGFYNQGQGLGNQGGPGNYGTGAGYNQFVPIKKQQFAKCILLSIITFGIYGIYYGYQYVKDVNRLCQGDGRESRNFIIVLLLSIITFGIYGYYWVYVQAERLKCAGERNGIKIHESGIVILLLWIFGGALCQLIAIYVMFDNTNRLASVYNGYVTREQVNSRPSNNAPIVIGAVITAILLSIGILLAVNLAVAPDEGPASRIDDRIKQNSRRIPELQREDGAFGYDFEDDEDTANLVVNIVNNTDFDILAIEALHKQHDEYDEALLDDNYVLAKGSSVSVPFEVYKNDPNYTFEITTEKGNEIYTDKIYFGDIKTNNPTLEIYKDGADVKCELK